MARRGKARLKRFGKAWPGVTGGAGLGWIWRGELGLDWVRLGEAGQARLGGERFGQARLGVDGEARRGKAGAVRLGADGMARPGMARFGWYGAARRGRLGADDGTEAEKGGKKMTYQWRIQKYGVAAETAAGELRRIERVHRVLRPGDVVEESRDPDAPLHGCFTWDDAKAGEKLRLREARDLIRNLQVVQYGCGPVNAFQSVQDKTRGYRSVDLVLSDPALRDQPEERARRAVSVAVERHSATASLTGAYRAVGILREGAEPRLDGQEKET